MNKPKFRYYFKSDATHYYYVAGGVVQTTTTPKPLTNAPMSWKETDLRWVRNSKYHGIFRSFVIPLTFVKEAATILRHIFYTQAGMESTCILYIEQLNHTTEVYDFYYSGDIDFSQKHDSRLTFQAAVIDSGLAALIKAYESTPQEIEILDSDCLLAYMHGLRLRNSSVLTLANDISATNTWHQMLPVIAVQRSESEVQVDVIEQPFQQGLGTTAIYQNYPFYKATIAGTVTIDYDITIQVGNSAGSSLGTKTFAMVIWQVNAANNAVVATQALYQNANFVSYIGSNRAKGTATFNLQPGERLAYFAGLVAFNPSAGADAFMVDQTYGYSTLTVSYDLKLPESVIKAYRYNTVFQKLIAKLTGGAYSGLSTFLSNTSLNTYDSKPWNTLVTCGDALRGLSGSSYIGPNVNPMPAARIKTTLEELHQDASVCWMTGIGIENNVVRLEHRSYFYRNDVVTVDIGEVDWPESYVALDYVNNLLKIGTANYDYDMLNGKDEPNTTQVYSFPIIRKKGEWDLVSPWRDDMYGIEIIRANLTAKKTTDAGSDNDTFVMEVEDNLSNITYSIAGATITTPAYRLARPQNLAGSSVTGLISGDSAFNLMRSPKRKFWRNGPDIRTAVHQQDGKTILFATTDKNANLTSKLSASSPLIVEKADVPVSSLPAPLFLPMIFQFETQVPVDLPALIAANPYGRVNFSARNRRGELIHFGGFIDEVGIKPANNEVYTWKLLACPDTDLSALIQ